MPRPIDLVDLAAPDADTGRTRPVTATLPPPDWMGDPAVAKVVEALSDDPARPPRFVGGCVRNWLLGMPAADIDIATALPPAAVTERARVAGLKPVPTGIDHGTITIVADHRGFEVTTLRRDVSTDGRRATVAFTDDWAEDARRRDLTMNALYAAADGTVFDWVGGLADLAAGRVRFVGDVATRLAEDMLRVLRYYRFHAAYGAGRPDPGIARLALARRDLIDRLSGERIAKEMLRLVTEPGAVAAGSVMAATGLLPALIPGAEPAGPDRLAQLTRLDPPVAGAIPRLAALLPLGGAEAVIDRLKPSRRRADRLKALTDADRLSGYPPATPHRARVAVYRDGNDLALALAASALARGHPVAQGFGWPVFAPILADFRAPRFPVRPRDLIARGAVPGPDLGRRLKALEAAWLEADMPAAWPAG